MRTRGFEIVADKFRKNDGEIVMPLRKTKFSAGYDLKVSKDIIIEPKSEILYWTDIKAYMLEDEVLKIYIRSSYAIKYDLYLKNYVPIIDSDYYFEEKTGGNIGLCICNNSSLPMFIKKGESVAQGIFEKYLVADNCNSDEIRTGGIGSTDK